MVYSRRSKVQASASDKVTSVFGMQIRTLASRWMHNFNYCTLTQSFNQRARASFESHSPNKHLLKFPILSSILFAVSVCDRYPDVAMWRTSWKSTTYFFFTELGENSSSPCCWLQWKLIPIASRPVFLFSLSLSLEPERSESERPFCSFIFKD